MYYSTISDQTDGRYVWPQNPRAHFEKPDNGISSSLSLSLPLPLPLPLHLSISLCYLSLFCSPNKVLYSCCTVPKVW